MSSYLYLDIIPVIINCFYFFPCSEIPTSYTAILQKHKKIEKFKNSKKFRRKSDLIRIPWIQSTKCYQGFVLLDPHSHVHSTDEVNSDLF